MSQLWGKKRGERTDSPHQPPSLCFGINCPRRSHHSAPPPQANAGRCHPISVPALGPKPVRASPPLTWAVAVVTPLLLSRCFFASAASLSPLCANSRHSSDQPCGPGGPPSSLRPRLLPSTSPQYWCSLPHPRFSSLPQFFHLANPLALFTPWPLLLESRSSASSGALADPSPHPGGPDIPPRAGLCGCLVDGEPVFQLYREGSTMPSWIGPQKSFRERSGNLPTWTGTGDSPKLGDLAAGEGGVCEELS